MSATVNTKNTKNASVQKLKRVFVEPAENALADLKKHEQHLRIQTKKDATKMQTQLLNVVAQIKHGLDEQYSEVSFGMRAGYQSCLNQALKFAAQHNLQPHVDTQPASNTPASNTPASNTLVSQQHTKSGIESGGVSGAVSGGDAVTVAVLPSSLPPTVPAAFAAAPPTKLWFRQLNVVNIASDENDADDANNADDDETLTQSPPVVRKQKRKREDVSIGTETERSLLCFERNHSWRTMYGHVKDFKSKNGHLFVPKTTEELVKLQYFIRRQRKAWRLELMRLAGQKVTQPHRLPVHRQKLLAMLNFNFKPSIEMSWMEQAQSVFIFAMSHDHIHLPRRHVMFGWLEHQLQTQPRCANVDGDFTKQVIIELFRRVNTSAGIPKAAQAGATGTKSTQNAKNGEQTRKRVKSVKQACM
ncbi:helicase associated domain-containing protein [bacterium]|nr:helicase associated domain-containing protein [bacterium]